MTAVDEIKKVVKRTFERIKKRLDVFIDWRWPWRWWVGVMTSQSGLRMARCAVLGPIVVRWWFPVPWLRTPSEKGPEEERG